MPIRVLIVDAHEIMRAGIKLACSDREDFEFVGEASTLTQAQQIASETDPDVAVVDPHCAGEGARGRESIGNWHAETPDLKLLMLAGNDSPEHATRLVEAGASGYLTKAAGLDEIAVAIRSVHAGRIFISHSRPTHAGANLNHSIHAGENHTTSPPPASKSFARPALSTREQEVLEMLADGMTNKQVAESLFLSVKTVETYRARIMKKHCLRDRAELVRFARRNLTHVPHPT